MWCCFPARLLLHYLTSSETSARCVSCREPPEPCLQPQARLLQRFFCIQLHFATAAPGQRQPSPRPARMGLIKLAQLQACRRSRAMIAVNYSSLSSQMPSHGLQAPLGARPGMLPMAKPSPTMSLTASPSS